MQMNWKLTILVIVILGAAVAFMTKSTSVEGFETETSKETVAKGAAYKAGSDAFDAYIDVHGRPPLSEPLNHYRKLALDNSLSKEDLVLRMKSDAQLPDKDKTAKLQATDSTVDKELEKLKTHVVVKETMTSPITPATASAAVSARLREIASQLNTMATDMTPSLNLNAPTGLESFIGF